MNFSPPQPLNSDHLISDFSCGRLSWFGGRTRITQKYPPLCLRVFVVPSTVKKKPSFVKETRFLIPPY